MLIYVCIYIYVIYIHTVSPSSPTTWTSLGCEDFRLLEWLGASLVGPKFRYGRTFFGSFLSLNFNSVPNLFTKVWTIVVGKFFVGHLLVHQESQFRRFFSFRIIRVQKTDLNGFILISLLNRHTALEPKKHDDCHQDDREETTYPGKHIRL